MNQSCVVGVKLLFEQDGRVWSFVKEPETRLVVLNSNQRDMVIVDHEGMIPTITLVGPYRLVTERFQGGFLQLLPKESLLNPS